MKAVTILMIISATSQIAAVTSQTFFKLDKGKADGEEDGIAESHFTCDRNKRCTHVIYNKKSKEHSLVSIGDDNLKKVKEADTVWGKVIFASCNEALPEPAVESDYWIKRENMRSAIKVRCKREGGKLLAVFDHDSEARIKVKGFESHGSYKRELKYKNSIQDIIAFVDSSSACKQFTRIDCHNMRLSRGYLVDRNGKPMPYFGGGPPNGTGCRCGITGTCHHSDTQCQCEANDNVWRFDEGYVTEKARLPLTQVRLGDTSGKVEEGAHTIGKLICEE